MKATIIPIAVCLFLSTFIAGGSHAAKAAENDAMIVQTVKVDLVQAVAAAERYAEGRASQAELERHSGRLVYEIEVVKAGEVLDVKVDSANGKILGATRDRIDRDGEPDREN